MTGRISITQMISGAKVKELISTATIFGKVRWPTVVCSDSGATNVSGKGVTNVLI